MFPNIDCCVVDVFEQFQLFPHIYTAFLFYSFHPRCSYFVHQQFHCSRGYRAYWRHHTWTFSPSFFLSIAFKPSSACLHLFFSVCLSLNDCSYNVLRCLTGCSLTVGIWHPAMLKCICFTFPFTVVQLLDFLP